MQLYKIVKCCMCKHVCGFESNQCMEQGLKLTGFDGHCNVWFEPAIGRYVSLYGHRWEVLEKGLKLVDTPEQETCKHEWTAVAGSGNTSYTGSGYFYCKNCKIIYGDFVSRMTTEEYDAYRNRDDK